MSIRDGLKEAFLNAKIKEDDLGKKTEHNFNTALEKLSSDLVRAVSSGSIKIEDTKDMRDLASIYAMLKQVSADTDMKDTPEMKDVPDYLKKVVGDKEMQDDVSGNIEGLSENDIEELLNKQAMDKNKDNIEGSA